MTTLDDVLEAPPETVPTGPTCGMGRWLQAQSPEHRDTIEGWFAGPYTSTAIHRRLSPVDGFDVSDFTLNRHRKMRCSCG